MLELALPQLKLFSVCSFMCIKLCYLSKGLEHVLMIAGIFFPGSHRMLGLLFSLLISLS